jgi:hypothetical protein
MRFRLPLCLAVALFVTIQRLPAPISEETPTPAPKPEAVPKPKPTPRAGNAQMGTWILNEGESTILGTGRNNKVVYKPGGDIVKVTVDGTDASGKPVHNEWTGRFDGKDYPVIADPTSDSRSYNKIDDRTLELTAKKNGKVAWTSRIVVSADGKSRTVTSSWTGAKGKKFMDTAVYDKQ